MFSTDPGRKNGFPISASYTGHDGTSYLQGTSTMDGNPHSFITQVQLYEEHGTPVAVASLSVPLPNNSGVDHLRMKIGDRYINGVIQKKEEAEKTYEGGTESGLPTKINDSFFSTYCIIDIEISTIV